MRSASNPIPPFITEPFAEMLCRCHERVLLLRQRARLVAHQMKMLALAVRAPLSPSFTPLAFTPHFRCAAAVLKGAIARFFLWRRYAAIPPTHVETDTMPPPAALHHCRQFVTRRSEIPMLPADAPPFAGAGASACYRVFARCLCS